METFNLIPAVRDVAVDAWSSQSTQLPDIQILNQARAEYAKLQ